MFPATDPLLRRCLLVALLVSGVLLLAAPSTLAAPPSSDRPAVCLGFSFMEIVSDRNRLIQVSVIIVAFGISLLWWKK